MYIRMYVCMYVCNSLHFSSFPSPFSLICSYCPVPWIIFLLVYNCSLLLSSIYLYIYLPFLSRPSLSLIVSCLLILSLIVPPLLGYFLLRLISSATLHSYSLLFRSPPSLHSSSLLLPSLSSPISSSRVLASLVILFSPRLSSSLYSSLLFSSPLFCIYSSFLFSCIRRPSYQFS